MLLCFIYLTLPNFAGKLLKALSKDGKQATKCNKAKNIQNNRFARPQFALKRVSKEKNRQRGMFARHQLALNSPWRVNKGKNRQKLMFARHGEWSYLGGEQGRLKLPRMTWHKPNGEESSTRHGE